MTVYIGVCRGKWSRVSLWSGTVGIHVCHDNIGNDQIGLPGFRMLSDAMFAAIRQRL